MWVAEKFIGTERRMDATDFGVDYLNNLVARNLIQVASRGFDGRIKSFLFHDLKRATFSEGRQQRFLVLLVPEYVDLFSILNMSPNLSTKICPFQIKVYSVNLQTLYNVRSKNLKPSCFSKFITLRRLKIRYISEEVLRALMDAEILMTECIQA
uniref:Disease resistance protein winged helix domain-containing protein n=1 Tax=Nicotiana tabacum TaxID=4097 RepID=A0A1S4AMV0_TOBAC|nr:PREDICTED: uncharacterized protein LOC107799205 [Nicotiana tabacum]